MYLNSGHASIGTQHRISERRHSFLLKFKYHDSLMSVCPPNVAFEYELSVCQLKFIGWIIIQNLFKVGPCRRIPFTSCSHVLFTLRLAGEGWKNDQNDDCCVCAEQLKENLLLHWL